MKITAYPFAALAAAMSLLTLAAPARGAPLQPGQVPDEAVWYAHLDVEKTLASTFGVLATEGMTDQERIRIRIFSRMFGFSLLDDLRAVTVYGMPGYPDGGVLTLKGKFDREYLVDVVSVNEGYEKFSHGSRTIHHWIDEKKGKQSFGVFADDDTLVLADSEALIRSALSAIDGRKTGRVRTPQGPSWASITEAALVVGVADFGRMSHLEPEAAILKEIASAHLAAAELGEELKIVMSLEAIAESSAVNLQRMADGLLAFAALNGDKPGLGRLASAITINRKGQQVEGTFSFPVEELVGILQILR